MTVEFLRKIVCISALVVLAAGCASNRGTGRAPVEDRGPAATAPTTSGPSAINAGSGAGTAAVGVKPPLPGAENAGKPGYYTVRPGDTVVRIALETGQNWRDIARWNNLDNPNLIEVGQVLRVVAPVASTAAAVGTAVAVGPATGSPASPGATPPLAAASGTASQSPQGTDSGVVTRPVTTSSISPTASPSAAAPPAPVATRPASAPAAAASAPADEEPNFIWPASGAVVTGFDEVKNKGLDIAGKAGDAVLAAADGRVVYAGAGLRGYGNLIIVQHNKTYLTAYAHNQALLVREDQSVRKGQKIAEMGSSDSDRVKLHFEVRRQGKPVDPSKLLPQR